MRRLVFLALSSSGANCQPYRRPPVRCCDNRPAGPVSLLASGPAIFSRASPRARAGGSFLAMAAERVRRDPISRYLRRISNEVVVVVT